MKKKRTTEIWAECVRGSLSVTSLACPLTEIARILAVETVQVLIASFVKLTKFSTYRLHFTNRSVLIFINKLKLFVLYYYVQLIIS